MKKFTKFLVCLIICVCSLALCACGNNKGDKFLPSSSAEITSNGGLIVKNGNFLYFNNGFVNEVDQKKNKKNYVSGSLMAAKLGEDGQPVFDIYGFTDVSQTRYITQRLTSYEAGNIFIFGNYVYYTSPCQEDIRGGGGWARKRVVFYRMHLNKSGKEEKLYQTSSDYDDVEFSYATDGQQLFLLVKDGDTLLRKSANGKNTVTIASEFNDVVFEENGYRLAFLTNEDGEYQLKLYNALSNTVEKENLKLAVSSYTSFSKAPELLTMDGESVYVKFSVKDADGDSDKTILAKAPYTSLVCEDIYYDQSASYNYYFYNGVILANKAGNIYRVENSTLNKIITDSASSIEIAGFANGMLIYVDGSLIKAVNIASNNKTEPDVTIDTEQTILSNYYDVLDNNLFYYAKINNGYYLHYVSLVQPSQPKMLGVYNEEDKPEVEQNDSESV